MCANYGKYGFGAEEMINFSAYVHGLARESHRPVQFVQISEYSLSLMASDIYILPLFGAPPVATAYFHSRI